MEERGMRRDDGNPRWSEESTVYEGEKRMSSPRTLGGKNSPRPAKSTGTDCSL